MAWDIGLTQIFKSLPLQSWRYRLLCSYLGVTGSIVAIFSLTVYGVVARDRRYQFDQHLQEVATVAAVSLNTVQHEYHELFTEEHHSPYVTSQRLRPGAPLSLGQLMGKYQFDPAYSTEKTVFLSISSPFAAEGQGVEWFDAQRRLMVQEGKQFPPAALPAVVPAEGNWSVWQDLRSFVMPVTTADAEAGGEVMGYVRVNASVLSLNQELKRLRKQLLGGILLVSGLVTWAGLWLTRQSLQPVLASFNQLQQFTSDASHELRNPLTAIRASVAVLQSHPERIHPADTQKLAAIASAAEQMSELVEDLLMLTRADRHRLQKSVDMRPIPLDELLEDLESLYGDRAAQDGISLTVEYQTPAMVEGDAAQLQRLFANLLTNALQYTPRGGNVRLTLQTTASHAIVRVQDTGIGIAADQLAQVLDRFWRADQARSYHQGGTGLGLAIAQAIADRHQGRITVSSQVNQGSCFQVTLPLGPRLPSRDRPGM
ncbi:MAG: sensor histidine kinase [Prochlorothrix sp.]